MEFFGGLGGGNDPLGEWGAGNRVSARGLSKKKWATPIILARTSSFASSSPIAEAFFSMHKLDICPVLYFLKRIFGYTTGKYVFGGKMMKISKTHFVTVKAAALLMAASLLLNRKVFTCEIDKKYLETIKNRAISIIKNGTDERMLSV